MRPHWFTGTPLSTNPPHGRLTKKNVWNRTGGALTVGGIYQFDTFGSATETTSDLNKWNDPVGGWSNIVAPGTRGDSGIDLTMWGGFFCVALTAAADDTASEVLIIGDTTVKVIGATTAVYSVYSPFRVTTGQVYGTMLIAATAPIGKVIGMLTETIYTEATTPAATAHTVFFNGFGMAA